jgi:hypothetical protein
MTIENAMLQEKTNLKAEIDRLQAVFNSEAYKTFHSGAQKRILNQLELMWAYYDVLRNRIAEEEFY